MMNNFDPTVTFPLGCWVGNKKTGYYPKAELLEMIDMSSYIGYQLVTYFCLVLSSNCLLSHGIIMSGYSREVAYWHKDLLHMFSHLFFFWVPGTEMLSMSSFFSFCKTKLLNIYF